MKIFVLTLVLLALLAIGAEGHGKKGKKGKKHKVPKKPKKEQKNKKECEASAEDCHHKYKYECNDLEWVNYLLDDAPGEYGVYLGDSSPGVPAFAGYGVFNSALGTALGTGRLQITDPKGIFSHRAEGYFSSDSSNIYYLKNNCNYKFEWVLVTKAGEDVPYGVETKYPKANGFRDYIARKNISSTKTVFGSGLTGKGIMYYVDELQRSDTQLGTSRDYEVLTCRSSSFASPPAPSPLPPPPTPNPSTECVHEWRDYNNDDKPESEGVPAGLHDVDNPSFVGQIYDGDIYTSGRIQTQEPGRGIYATKNGQYSRFTSGGKYLYNNPNYHYYWVESYRFPTIPNAVRIPVSPNNPFRLNIGRVQVDGQVYISRVNTVGFPLALDGGSEIFIKNYQTLVCDPRPANPCKQVWKHYENDDAPSNDGFRVDFYKDGIVSYIGRSDNKRVSGHDYVIGRVQVSPSNDSGVYTLQSVNGGEKFDPYHGEYLVKNSGDLYEWVNAHTAEEVRNALKVPITHATDCCHDGHHKESAYIGRFYIDNVVHIGTVYEREGLAFVDVNGNRKVVSSFQVLTCNSPVKNEEEEEDHHDCDCNHKCLDEEKFYYH